MEVIRFAALAGSRVYIDTNILIYFLEKHPQWIAQVLPLFEMAAQGTTTLVTSELTVAEILVHPYKLGRADLATRYKRFLKDEGIVELIALSFDILDAAAATRAALGGTLADAMHVATATLSGCTAFVSNDAEIRLPPPATVITLRQLQ